MRREIPILFSTPMVQAILENRKTKTRREIKPQPIDNREVDGNFFEGNHKGYVKVDGHSNWQKQFAFEFSPYGKPGDLLWVRESGWVDNNYIPGLNEPHLYWKADYEKYPEWEKVLIKDHCCRFPSIHMYKIFTRIWLEVVSIKVEKLQNITEEDAKAEGVDLSTSVFDMYKPAFQYLWFSINGTESWNQNPWVWVIEFKVLSTTGKPKN